MNQTDICMAVAVPRVRLADCKANAAEIERLAGEADAVGVQLLLTPELSLTGATCLDLFKQELLVEQAAEALAGLMERTAPLRTVVVAGLPVRTRTGLADVAVAFAGGRVLCATAGQYHPAGPALQTSRWFVPGCLCAAETPSIGDRTLPLDRPALFSVAGHTFGLELGGDLPAPLPPHRSLVASGAQTVLVAAARPCTSGSFDRTARLLAAESRLTGASLLYVSAGYGESTTDLVFDGAACLARDGRVTSLLDRFGMQSAWSVCPPSAVSEA